MRLVLIGILFSLRAAALTTEAPVWEFGLGLGTIVYPDYHGSDEYNFLPVPAPFYVNRRMLVKYDDEGMQGRFWRGKYYKFSGSFGVGPPVDSSRNKARKGMNDLASILEFGLELDLTLFRYEAHSLHVLLPYRWAFSIASFREKPRNRGRVFSPSLSYQLKFYDAFDIFEKFRVGTGPMFSTEAYHRYYYDVKEKYVTGDREAFRTQGGFSGWGTIAYLSMRRGDFWGAVFVKHEDLREAEFKDSPLMKTHDYFAVGTFFVYVLNQSKETVDVDY